MTVYCTYADVKVVLQVEVAETAFDAELSGDVISASALADGLLNAQGLVVPDPVPQLIVDATMFFAAYLFRIARDPGSAAGFWREAQRLLQVYVDAELDAYVGTA